MRDKAAHTHRIDKASLTMVREPERCEDGLQVTYNTLIDVYGKLGRWEDALQVLQRMKTQVSMMHGCCYQRGRSGVQRAHNFTP